MTTAMATGVAGIYANFDLLDKVLSDIKAWRKRVKNSPEEITEFGWSQSSWAVSPELEGTAEQYHCKTALCFAGYTVHNSGYAFFPIIRENGLAEVDLDPIPEEIFDHVLDQTKGMTPDDTAEFIRKIQPNSVSTLARRLLGVEEADANRLFAATNTVERLEEIIEEWRANARAAGRDV